MDDENNLLLHVFFERNRRRGGNNIGLRYLDIIPISSPYHCLKTKITILFWHYKFV